MDSNSDVEELPYVVWYQCRMCTHLLFDDIEKMFMHFDKKHGAMIDCDELKSIVYKNGLCMGGLSRSPKPVVKFEDDNETETELISPCTRSVGDDDEDLEKLHHQEIENNGMVLSNVHDEDDYEKDNYKKIGAIGGSDEEYEDYEESAYESTNINERKNVLNIHDDEEQLAEGDFDCTSGNENEDNHYDLNEELADGDGDEDRPLVIDTSRLCQRQPPLNLQLEVHDEYDEQDNHEVGDYQEDGHYHEEGEEGELSVSAEQSINEEDLDELIYGDEMDYDVGDDDDDDGAMYSNDGSQPSGILNYGFSCKFCGKFFTTRRGVESHEQHHKNQPSPIIRRATEGRHYPCKICKNKSFSSFKDLKMHVKTHTPERIHICKFCFSTFNNTASLTKHLTIHNTENPHKCHCGKTFVSANTLKIHRKIHTGIKPFVCNFFQCGRAFVTKSTLESHLRTHTGEKPYQCSFCPSSFTTSSAKYRHERHVHKVPEPSMM